MSWKRRIVLSLSGLTVILALLAAAFLYYAPKIIRTDAVKDRVTSAVSRYLGRDVQVGTIDFRVFPLPSLVFEGITLSPEKGIEADAEALRLYPSFRNLLRGSIIPGRVELLRPRIKAVLSPDSDADRPGNRMTAGLNLEKLSAHVLSAASLLSLLPPELGLSALDGFVEVQLPARPVVRLEAVNLHAQVRGDRLLVTLEADSSLWRLLSMEASAQVSEAQVGGTLSLRGFQADVLQKWYPGWHGFDLGPTPTDLKFDFDIKGLRQDYRFSAALPDIPFTYEGQPRTVRGLAITGSFSTEDRRREVVINELRLQKPALLLSASYRTNDADTPRTHAGVVLEQGDVTAVRDLLIPVFPGLAGPHGLFSILRGGHVSNVNFEGQGPDLRTLFLPENWVLTGRGEGLDIHVPHFPFLISEATGNVRIEGGILSGKNLEGVIEGGRLSDAALNLDLFNGDGVFGLEGNGQISANTLLLLLKEYIKNEQVRTELFRFRDVYGRAEGRLVLAGTRRRIGVSVGDAALTLAVSHEGLPLPVRIDRGIANYEGQAITFRNLAGSMGSSVCAGVSGRLSWAGDPTLQIEQASGQIDVAEFVELVRTRPGGRKMTSAIVSVTGGTADVSTLSLSGPLFVPREWDYHISGRFRGLGGHIDVLPGEIVIEKAGFEATTGDFSFRSLQAHLMQAEVFGSLNVSGYRTGPAVWNLDLSGIAGSEAVRYVSAQMGLPETLQVRTPVSFSNLWVRHRSGEGGALQGTLGFESGVTIRSALRYAGGDVEVEDLEIRDGDRSAMMRLVAGKGMVDGQFKGALRQRTLDRIVRAPEGWWEDAFLEGDVLLHIDFRRPLESLFTGTLKGAGVTLPVSAVGPVHIDAISVKGQGSSLLVEDADVRVLDQTFSARGEVNTSGEALVLDMDLAAEGIPWSRLSSALSPRAPEPKPSESALPVQGVVHVQAGFLEFNGHTWRPFLGDLVLRRDGSRRLRIRDAAMCDISSTGTLEQKGDSLRFNIDLLARGQELGPTVACLSEKQSAMTGRFDLTGKLKGEGRFPELKRAAVGTFTVKATEGRIHKAVLLARILEVLTVSEVIKGSGFEDLDKGFAYDSLELSGEFRDGLMVVQEAVLDGGGMDLVMEGTIDLETKEIKGDLLVAPLTTVDWVVKRIPIVSYILDGSLVTIPLEIGGTVGDPKVRPMSVLGTGKRLLGLLGRVVGAPVKVIEPILPSQKNP